MWLKNYYQLMAFETFGVTNVFPVKDITGVSANLGSQQYSYLERLAAGNNANVNVPTYSYRDGGGYSRVSANSCIVFGTGSTAVTFDDYALETKLSTSEIVRVSATKGTPTLSDSSKVIWSNDLTTVIRNTGESSITITEWGIETTLHCTSGNSSVTKEVLLFRELFVTPVTLAQGDTATLTLTLNYAGLS